MSGQDSTQKKPFRPRNRKTLFNNSPGPTNEEARRAWLQIGITPHSDESREIWAAIRSVLVSEFPETLQSRTLHRSMPRSILRRFLEKEGPQLFSGTNLRYSSVTAYTPLFDDAQLESHYGGLLFLIRRAHDLITQEKARGPRPTTGMPSSRPNGGTSNRVVMDSSHDLFVPPKKQLEVQFGVVSKDFTKLHLWDNLWNNRVLTQIDKTFVHALFTFVEKTYRITPGPLEVAEASVFDAEDKGQLYDLQIPGALLVRSEPNTPMQIQSFILNTAPVWANAQGVLQLRVIPCNDEIVVRPGSGVVELTKKRTFDQMVDGEDV